MTSAHVGQAGAQFPQFALPSDKSVRWVPGLDRLLRVHGVYVVTKRTPTPCGSCPVRTGRPSLWRTPTGIT